MHMMRCHFQALSRSPTAAAVRGWALLVLALTLLLSCGACSTDTSPRTNLQIIRSLQVLETPATSMPEITAPWETVQLPHRAPRIAGATLAYFWYKAEFTAALADGRRWLYMPNLATGGAVYLNGALVADIRSADADVQVRWYQPHLLMLPPALLRQGTNLLSLRLATREPTTSLGVLEIGPEQLLRSRYDAQLFWQTTTAEVSAAVCLVASGLILLFWLRRPQETLYALFGACMLLWGARTLMLQLTVVPMPYLTLWRTAYYFATGGFMALISIFMLQFSGLSPPRLRVGVVCYWLSGCVVFALAGMNARWFMNSIWLLGFLPVTLFAVWRLMAFGARQRTGLSVAMGIAFVIAVSLGLHDFMVQQGWGNLREIFLLHLGIPLVLLVMAAALLGRFIDSLARIESHNGELAMRVAEREQEITASYGRLRQLERIHAATEERQRIMQDMHDGVGAHLLTTMAIVQRGPASRETMLILLQECVDDMRLAVESLAPDDPDLLPVLGSFRFRMTSRYRAIGLTLQWINLDLPERLEVAPHTSLHVLRLLQEALANVVKHAQASIVQVQLQFSPETLYIDVTDDGIGFSMATRAAGHGLANMRSRASRIGATFEVLHPVRGTTVRFKIPLLPQPAVARLPGTDRRTPMDGAQQVAAALP
jgi:signal transduction histidine kinase